MELGLLDTIYLRQGHYDDEAGHITMTIKGFGINLHYKDYFAQGTTKQAFRGELVKTRVPRIWGEECKLLKLMEAIRIDAGAASQA